MHLPSAQLIESPAFAVSSVVLAKKQGRGASTLSTKLCVAATTAKTTKTTDKKTAKADKPPPN